MLILPLRSGGEARRRGERVAEGGLAEGTAGGGRPDAAGVARGRAGRLAEIRRGEFRLAPKIAITLHVPKYDLSKS